MFIGVLCLCRDERFFSNIVGDDVLGVPKRMKLISPMAMQKSLFHKNSRHLTTANAYVSGRRGRRPLQGWRVRFRCRVAISNTPINQNLNDKLMFIGVLCLCRDEQIISNIVGTGVLDCPKTMGF